MLNGETTLLRNLWYLAVPGRDLKPGKMLGRRFMGEPVLLCRTHEGEVFALRDVCPHRGVPLRHGSFDGREVACAYHGWRFGGDGRCTAIPSLVPGQKMDPNKIKVPRFPCREVQGNVWVFFGDLPRDGDESGLPPVPRVPDLGDAPPQVSIRQDFPCNADHAAFGLMDPTHAAFVHTSWWWKKQARTLRRKTKRFEPAPLGWRMSRHRLPPENRVYKLLGDNVTTEIAYSLPGIRIEHIKGDKHTAASLTAITPITENATVVHQAIYWTVPWLAPLRPVGRVLAGMFLNQDREMVLKQQEGLADNPSLMLIDDADTQAKWFHRIKKEWLRASAEGRDFRNPIKPKTLEWHS